MLRNYDLWITNQLTGDIEVVHDFDFLVRSKQPFLSGCFLHAYLTKYFDKETPFKVEFHYK